MLRFSILLLFALQISAVFCRSTADYNDETTDSENTAVSYSEAYEDKKELNLSNEMHNQSAVLQGTALYGDEYYIRRANDAQFTVILAVSISMGIFLLCSLILGFILCICCRSKPRPGYIVRNVTGNETTNVQQRPGPIAMQPYPSNQGSVLQYPPATQPMKQPPTNPYQQ